MGSRRLRLTDLVTYGGNPGLVQEVATREALGGRELKALLRAKTARPSKFRNVPTWVDGIRFASIREAERYQALKLLLAAGRIRDLRLQVTFELEVNGVKICSYRADFVYHELVRREWKHVAEDAKGARTPVYLLKRKLMLAVHGISVRET
jgi:hypothetical protein